jgi:hypothetical protein
MSLIQLVETSKTEAIPAPFPNTKGTVTIKALNSDQSFGPAVAILRMEPGSEIPRQLHCTYKQLRRRTSLMVIS